MRLHIKKTALRTVELVPKLHGFLMSQLPTAYVEQLHELDTNPYALYVTTKGDYHVWTVHLLTQEAIEVIAPVLDSLFSIRLDSYDEPLVIDRKEVCQRTVEELLDLFRTQKTDGTFKLRFVTPTSFKVQGEYILFPSVHLIMQSLMQKYHRLIDHGEPLDYQLLDMIEQNSKIVSYDLKTWYFTVHRHKIPAFHGEVTLKVYGSETLKAYVNMLLHFGEYSGVGIKNSLGMGGLVLDKG